MKLNKNYKKGTIIPMIFIFTIMSFVSMPTEKAEAFSVQEAIDTITGWIFPESESSKSSDENYDSDDDGEDEDASSSDDGSEDVITDVSQIRDSFDNINTFTPFGSYSKNSKNKKQQKGDLAYFLSDNSNESTNIEISFDYNFDIDEINSLNSLFATDDINPYQEDYDKYINGDESASDEESSSEADSNNNDENNGILSSLSNIASDIGSYVEQKAALATGLAVGAYSLYSSLYQPTKKEEEENQEYSEDDLEDNSSNEDNSSENNEDDVNSGDDVNNDNNLEGNTSEYKNSSNFTPHQLSSADYAKISASIANMPDASSLCDSTLLSTIEDFISSTTSYWQGEDLTKLASCIISKANEYDVNPIVICAQIKQESGFTPTAGSPAGAVGISQFMPSTAASLGIDPWNVEESIQGQCEYMSDMMKKFGDYSLALAGYNAGGAAVSSYGGIPPYRETQNYVSNISSMISDLTNEYNNQIA